MLTTEPALTLHALGRYARRQAIRQDAIYASRDGSLEWQLEVIRRAGEQPTIHVRQAFLEDLTACCEAREIGDETCLPALPIFRTAVVVWPDGVGRTWWIGDGRGRTAWEIEPATACAPVEGD